VSFPYWEASALDRTYVQPLPGRPSQVATSRVDASRADDGASL